MKNQVSHFIGVLSLKSWFSLKVIPIHQINSYWFRYFTGLDHCPLTKQLI